MNFSIEECNLDIADTIDVFVAGQDDDDDGIHLYDAPQARPFANYLEGNTGPKRCCYAQCREIIVGTPLTSEGLPYHPTCYHKMRSMAATETGATTCTPR